jgi:prefoldin subunit 5
MARPPEVIQQEIDAIDAEIRELDKLPTRYTVHGQTIDNTERLANLRSRLKNLRAELDGRSIFQGPWIEI